MWFSSVFKPEIDIAATVASFYASSEKYCKHPVRKQPAKLPLFDFDKVFREDPLAAIVPCGCELDGKDIASGSTEYIKRMLFQESSSNLNFISSCKCGSLRGNFAKGLVCAKCKTEVRDTFASEISFRAWLEIPDFMPPMLHPAVYRVLGKWMGCIKRKKKIIDLLLDVDSELPEPYASTLGQGPSYFYENFDNIIRFFLNQNRGARAKRNAYIEEFIATWRHCLFIRHVPVLNQALHILTKSGTLTYNDDASTSILTTCIELSSAIYNYRHNPTNTSIANRNYLDQYSYAVFKSYIDYTEKIFSVKVEGKYGFLRKSLIASRLNNTFRAVIVPIVVEHQADECHLPWKIGVAMNKCSIINILMNRYHMSMPEANDRYCKALVMFDPLIREVLDILMKECPYKGLPVLLNESMYFNIG